MKNDIDVEPTAEAIDGIANRLFSYSNDLHRIAKRMREEKDLKYAGEALNEISNCLANLLREYERLNASHSD